MVVNVTYSFSERIWNQKWVPLVARTNKDSFVDNFKTKKVPRLLKTAAFFGAEEVLILGIKNLVDSN